MLRAQGENPTKEGTKPWVAGAPHRSPALPVLLCRYEELWRDCFTGRLSAMRRFLSPSPS
jgi:hypothetical protein